MSKIIIVGGGAAGMFASIFAARNGNDVHIYEKNEKLGKKLFITGKGRCNITNACDMEDLFEHMRSNKKFLYSCLYGYNNFDVIDFFESLGLSTKIERGNRVFPLSDRSSDVINALSGEMKRLGVAIHLNMAVKGICTEEGQIKGVKLINGQKESADRVIIATGGISYESTGSTGDGYRFAKETGHKITKLSPSLVPVTIKEPFVKNLQGLSLKNVQVKILDGKKKIFEDFGEMLFTHFGVSGPLILSGSSFIAEYQSRKKEEFLILTIDLKPALTFEQLEARILRDFEMSKNKQFKNAVTGLFPSKLIPVMIELSGIDPDKKVNEISKEERQEFASLIKNLKLTITGLRDFNEAVITRGGVEVKEINPSTMESKIINNLFFVGEVLDLDALTGGFNLQIAWSTAYAAGNQISTSEGI